MSDERRSTAARVGVSALNLLSPGAGLLRIGRGRSAALLLALVPSALLLVVAYYSVTPSLTYVGYATVTVLALVVLLGALLFSVGLTWRWSKDISAKLDWWSRWYSILSVVFLGSMLAGQLGGVAHGFYKPFYIPSEGMAPTLLKNDRLVASMTLPDVLRRGDIILFDTPAGVYIKRIAGLPGDRISMNNGVVSINGNRVEQQFLRTERVDGSDGWVQGRRLIERFPGERGTHQIYDLESSPFDDVPEQIVAAGHLFVLGDNRDRSADSRVPIASLGVEQVPIRRVHGKALFFSWGAKAGQPITP